MVVMGRVIVCVLQGSDLHRHGNERILLIDSDGYLAYHRAIHSDHSVYGVSGDILESLRAFCDLLCSFYVLG